MNHILYNPSLLKKSYETTQVIQDKINAVIREVLPVSDDFCFVQLNPEETFQNDGSLFNQKLELKQRQSFYISEVYNKERQPYVDTTIQRSSTMHQSDIFIIYDYSMQYIQTFVDSDIQRETVFRVDNTEYGKRKGVQTPIPMYKVPTDQTLFTDLENPEDIIKFLQFISKKLII